MDYFSICFTSSGKFPETLYNLLFIIFTKLLFAEDWIFWAPYFTILEFLPPIFTFKCKYSSNSDKMIILIYFMHHYFLVFKLFFFLLFFLPVLTHGTQRVYQLPVLLWKEKLTLGISICWGSILSIPLHVLSLFERIWQFHNYFSPHVLFDLE